MEPIVQAQERRSGDQTTRLLTLFAESSPAPLSSVARAVADLGPDVLGAPSIAWVPRDGDEDGWSFIGWGSAARITGFGEDRFDEIKASAARLWSRIDRAGALPFAPRAFGGFAFDAGSDKLGSGKLETSELARAWAPFGHASFLLPRVLYGKKDDKAFIAAFVPESEASQTSTLMGAVRRAIDNAQPVFFPSPAMPEQRPISSFDLTETGNADARHWIDLVRRALVEIEHRSLDKVVLCRTRRIELSQKPDLVRAFALLETRHRPCMRFLFEQDGAVILGATPERLLLVQGRRALTEALAGSLPRTSSEDANVAADKLLRCAKDRAEHAFVVDAIRNALAPASSTLKIPDTPIVREFSHVYHLATPIVAMLRERTHVLELARTLHPTPALCGSPRAPARAFLLAAEPEPRGFYGGGIGWIDAAGDGAIAVAIRTALIVRNTAWIYAGAGIVQGSDPALEYKETTVKERAMREALEVAA